MLLVRYPIDIPTTVLLLNSACLLLTGYNITLGACSGHAWAWALVLLEELGELGEVVGMPSVDF